jgi:RHS repeat-associated protein
VGALALTSSTDLFGFDGDGLCNYGVSGCPFGPTGYEGPNTSFSDVSADQTGGVVNFPFGLAPGGGSTYFSLEEALSTSNVSTGTGEAPVSGTEQGGAPNPRENVIPCFTAKPINCATGDFWHTFSDLSVPGRGPALALTRTYTANAAGSDGPFGFGWTDSYAVSLSVDGSGSVTVHQEDGSTVTFAPNGSGFIAPSRVQASLVKHADGSYALTDFHGGLVHNFDANGVLTNETDRNGYTTTLTYTSGRLSAVTDPAGRSLTFTYNVGGRVSQVADSASRTVTYGYDGSGNLTDATDAAGGHWQFGYDSAHRMNSMTDPNGGVTSNVYDAQNRVTQQTDPKNRTTTFAYSGDPSTTTGSTTTITDPRGLATLETYKEFALSAVTTGSGTPQAATTTYSYDPFLLGIASQTDGNGHTTTFTYDRAGNRLTKTDSLGRTTTDSWTALNLPRTLTDPAGTTTTLSYDGNGNLTTVSRPLVSSGQEQTTRFTYGDATYPGDITAATDPDGNASNFSYNAHGDLTSVTNAAGDKTSYGHDGIGRRTSMVTPRGNAAGANPADYTWTYTYDGVGRLKTATDPLGHTQVNNTYDGNGNVRVATDANGNVTTNHYSADDELTSVDRANSTTISYSYDGDGNQISYTDGAGNVTTYAFDDAGLPNLATSVTDADNRTTRYGYDRAGNLISKQQPAGNCSAIPATGCTSYGYDAADEPTGISFSDGTTPGVTFTYTDDGQRASMSDGTGTTSYTYDSLNRLTGTTDGAGNTVGYGYDLAGNTTRITYPNGQSVARAYDAANRLTNITDWLGHTTTISPDPNGNTNSIGYGNGVTGNQSFNHADQLTGITDSKSGSTLASFTYTRDANGQLASLTPTGVTQSNETYSYSQLNQLSGVNSNSYGYDAADNLTSLPNGNTQSFDPADQLLASSPSPITFVGAAARGNSGVASTGVNLPAGTSAGDLILLAVTLPVQYTPTTPTGYTVVGTYTSGTANGEAKEVVYKRIAAAGDTSVTVTVPNGLYGYSFVVGVYRGVDPNNPIDVNSSGSTSGGLSVIAPAATTTTPNDRLVILDGENHSNVAPHWTPPTGMTQRAYYAQPTSSAMIADASQPSPGTTGGKTSTLTNPSSASIVSVLLALQPVHTAYSFNNRGDRITRTTATGTLTSYSYDQANRLTSTTTGGSTSSYGYNGDGLRISHSDGGSPVQQVWDLTSRVPLLLADGGVSYLYDAEGNPIEQIDGAGTVLYYQHDQYGSTRVLTNASGAVVATFTYDAYGQLTSHTGTADTALRWNGQFQDSTGLYYLRFRYYDPAPADFITRDPVEVLTGAAYGYAKNNPLNVTDADGMCPSGSVPLCVNYVSQAAFGEMQIDTRYASGLTRTITYRWLIYDYTERAGLYSHIVWVNDRAAQIGGAVGFQIKDDALHGTILEYNEQGDQVFKSGDIIHIDAQLLSEAGNEIYITPLNRCMVP